MHEDSLQKGAMQLFSQPMACQWARHVNMKSPFVVLICRAQCRTSLDYLLKSENWTEPAKQGKQ